MVYMHVCVTGGRGQREHISAYSDSFVHVLVDTVFLHTQYSYIHNTYSQEAGGGAIPTSAWVPTSQGTYHACEYTCIYTHDSMYIYMLVRMYT
jgi:hypothetical protein